VPKVEKTGKRQADSCAANKGAKKLEKNYQEKWKKLESYN
jgi:hypothetical protein